MRKIILLLAAVGLAMTVASVANAQSQIVVFGSSQNVTFTSSGGVGSNVNVALGTCIAGTCTLSGPGAFQQGASFTGGSYSFTTTGGTPFLTSGDGGVTFSFKDGGAGIAFHFDDGLAGDFLNGTIKLTTVSDDTPSPRFVGTLTVTSTSSGKFASLWPMGDVVKMDFTVALGDGPTLKNVFNHTTATTTNGPISSGQVLPAPEPASMALLGSGLVAVGAFLRRRKHS